MLNRNLQNVVVVVVTTTAAATTTTTTTTTTTITTTITTLLLVLKIGSSSSFLKTEIIWIVQSICYLVFIQDHNLKIETKTKTDTGWSQIGFGVKTKFSEHTTKQYQTHNFYINLETNLSHDNKSQDVSVQYYTIN